MRKTSRIDYIILITMGLLIAGVYWPQWLFGRTALELPHMRDIISAWYPHLGETAQGYRGGILPLWDSFNLFGSPMVAIPYTGAIYFPQAILLVVFDYLDAVPLSISLHSFLAGAFMYGLVRRQGGSPVSGFIIGLSYPLTGFFFATNNHPTHVNTFTWVPLVYWSCIEIMERPRLKWFLLMGLSAWLMALGGEVEAFIYHLIGLFLFMVFVDRMFMDRQRFKSALVVLAGLVVSGLLFQPVFLTAFELLHHSIRNPELGLSVQFVSIFSEKHHIMVPLMFFPFDFLKNHFPFDVFNKGLSPLYPGMIVITMLLMAIRYFRRDPEIGRLCYWFLAVTITGIMLMTPQLEPFIKHLPLVGSMANRFKWMEVVGFAMLIIAAKGIDAFLDELKETIPRPAIVFTVLWGVGIVLTLSWCAGGNERLVLAGFLIVAGAWLLVLRSRNKTVAPRHVAWALVLIFLADIYSLDLQCIPRNPKEVFRAPRNLVEMLKKDPPDYRHRFLVLEGVFHSDLAPEITGMLQVQARADTITTCLRLPLYRPFNLAYKVFPPILQQGADGKRYYEPTEMHNPSFLNVNSMHLLNLTAVRYLISRRYSLKFSSPYHLLKPKALPSGPEYVGGVRFADAGSASPAVTMDYPSRLSFKSTVYENSRLEMVCDKDYSTKVGFLQLALQDAPGEKKRLMFARAFGNNAGGFCSGDPVKVDLGGLEPAQYEYQISALPLGDSNGQVVLHDLSIVRPGAPLQEAPAIPGVYINKEALPRAYVVHRAQVIESEPDILARVLDPASFDPKDSVVLSGTDPSMKIVERTKGHWPWHARERVEVQSYDSVSASLSVKMDGPGYLVLSDAYYPGWRVWVNGIEQNIIRANYAFRAVFVDHGQNRVVFKYVPASFRIGWWVMIASLAMIGIVVLTRRFGRSR